MQLIEGYGLSIEIPDGWYGRIYRRDAGPGDITKPIIHVANAALSAYTDDDTLAGTIETMGSRGVAVAIFELEPMAGFADPAMGFTDVVAATIRPDDARPLQGVPWNLLSFLRRIHKGGRYFQIRVVFGSDRAPADVFAQVNQLLGSLRVEQAAAAGVG